MLYSYKNLTIEVKTIYKPRNKTTYYQIKADGLYISSPIRFNDKKIIDFIALNYDKILKLKNNFDKKNKRENVVHLFGFPYKIEITFGNINDVIIEYDTIHIYSSSQDERHINIELQTFYASELKKYLATRYNELYILYADYILIKPTISFKILKTCYGKYNRKNNEITLATSLAKYDKKYIDLVICHELTHYKYMNHQKEFYDLLESKLPNAKIIQKNLRKTNYNDYF